MDRPRKPLLGFGWIGYLLLPVLCFLAWVYLTGFDLRFELMQLIYPRFRFSILAWLIVRLYYLYLGLPQSQFGPIALMYVLVAWHIHPRRIRWWWYVSLVALALTRPTLEYLVVDRLGLPPKSTNIALTILCLGALEAAFFGLATRSRIVMASVFVAAAWSAMLAWRGLTPGTGLVIGAPTGGPWIGPVPVTTAMWHTLIAAPMLFWAVRARRHQRQPWECPTCGYDRRGSGEKCPECGAVA